MRFTASIREQCKLKQGKGESLYDYLEGNGLGNGAKWLCSSMRPLILVFAPLDFLLDSPQGEGHVSHRVGYPYCETGEIASN